MKIEINNNGLSLECGLEIIANGKKLININGLGFRQYEFSEDEIYYIIGEKEFEKFKKIEKFIFEVPLWKLDVISGKGLKNADSFKNKWSYNYGEIKS
jgi:hypothetical protein